MAAEVKTSYSLAEGLARLVEKLPGLLGNVAGVLAGKIAAIVTVASFLKHEAGKVWSVGGRNEILYGRPSPISAVQADLGSQAPRSNGISNGLPLRREAPRAAHAGTSGPGKLGQETNARGAVMPANAVPEAPTVMDVYNQTPKSTAKEAKGNRAHTSTKELQPRPLTGIQPAPPPTKVPDAEELFSRFSSRPKQKTQTIQSFNPGSDRAQGKVHTRVEYEPTDPSAISSLPQGASKDAKKAQQAVLVPPAVQRLPDHKISASASDREPLKPLNLLSTAVPKPTLPTEGKPTPAKTANKSSTQHPKITNPPSTARLSPNPIEQKALLDESHEADTEPKGGSHAALTSEGITSHPVRQGTGTPSELTDLEALASQSGDDYGSPKSALSVRDFQETSPGISPLSSPNGSQGKARKEKKTKGMRGAFRKLRKALSNN